VNAPPPELMAACYDQQEGAGLWKRATGMRPKVESNSTLANEKSAIGLCRKKHHAPPLHFSSRSALS